MFSFNILGDPWNCKEEVIEETSLAMIVEGIADFSTFSAQLQIQLSNPIKIIQLTKTSSFLLFDTNLQEMKRLKNDFNYFHYQAHSIFLDDSYFDKFVDLFGQKDLVMPIFKEELYYLFYEANNYQILKNYTDLKIFTKSPPRYFCGFTTLSDLVKSYAYLIQEGKNWPIFALSNKFIEKVNRNRFIQQKKFKDNNSILYQNVFSGFPHFNRDSKLFYLSFIEKEIKKQQRIQNSIEMYSINEINDVQISHIYKEQIRTFLGFKSLFRCLHVFDYFLHVEKESNSITDLILIENSNSTKFNEIRYNLFYIEIQDQSLFDVSLLFSMNYVNLVNLNKSSFYGFDNQLDFQSALKIFENSTKITINDVKLVDPSEFKIKFDKNISDKMAKTKFFFIVLLTPNNNLNGLQTILKTAKIIEKNVNYRIDSKIENYVLAGFINMDDRAKAFLALKNLQKSSEIRFFYPENPSHSSFQSSPKRIRKQRKDAKPKHYLKETIDQNEQNIEEKEEEEEEEENIDDNEYDNNEEEFKKQFQIENQQIKTENKYQQQQQNQQQSQQKINQNNEIKKVEKTTEVLNNTQKPSSQNSNRQKNHGPDFFTPNQNLIYLYFIEKEKARKIMQGKQVKLTLFGVKKCKDIQRYKRLNDEESGYFTFFGFDNLEDANVAVNDIKSKWLSQTAIKIYDQTTAFIQQQKEPNSIYDDDKDLFIQAIQDKKQKTQNKMKTDEKISTSINDVKINIYKPFILNSPFCFYFNQMSIPTNIQLELKKTLTKTKSVTNIVKDVIPYNFLYEPYTFIMIDSFQSMNHTIFKSVFSHYKIGYCSNDYELYQHFSYLEFSEKIIPDKTLNNFLYFLSLSDEVTNIERDVFHSGSIVTIISFDYPKGQYILQLIEAFLSQEKCLFNQKKYSIKKAIYFNEEVLLKRKEDFDLIVNEIESFGIKPINIERNKLLFLSLPYENQFLIKFSFICFKSIQDKLKALNHMNSILLKDKDNVMKFNPSLFYLKIDPFKYCSDSMDDDPWTLLSKVVKDLSDVGDFQLKVFSIDSPVELAYIGFKSKEYLAFYNQLVLIRLHHLCLFPNSKFFNPRKNLLYIQFQTVHDVDLFKLIDRDIAARIKDYQTNCTEIGSKDKSLINYVGFESEQERNFLFFQLTTTIRNPNIYNVMILGIDLKENNFNEVDELFSENILTLFN